MSGKYVRFFATEFSFPQRDELACDYNYREEDEKEVSFKGEKERERE